MRDSDVPVKISGNAQYNTILEQLLVRATISSLIDVLHIVNLDVQRRPPGPLKTTAHYDRSKPAPELMLASSFSRSFSAVEYVGSLSRLPEG